MKTIRFNSKADWLAWRSSGLHIGGSDAAAACGLSPYKSQLRLWAEKTERYAEEPSGEAIEIGTAMEPVIMDIYRQRNPRHEVICPGHEVYISDAHPWQVGAVDGIGIDESGYRYVIEAKNLGYWTGCRIESQDDIPIHYLCQIHHYLAVTGYDYGMFVAIVGGNKFLQIRVDHSQSAIDRITALEADFVEMVKSRTPPEPGAGDADVLAAMYPDNGTEAEVSDEMERLARDYASMGATIREMEALRDRIGNQIRYLMGENSIAQSDRVKVTWKQQTSQRFDAKKAKEIMPPGMYESYLRETISRVLRVKTMEVKGE